MAVRLRLQRFGKKRKPFYHVVAIDSRVKRDGKFIEHIGNYDPNTNPATINIDTEKAMKWLSKGATPSDTTRALLSYTGVLYKNHLAKGVAKGALTEEQAAEKFAAWRKQKDEKINKKKEGLAKAQDQLAAQKLKAESEQREKMQQEQQAAKLEAQEKLKEGAEPASDDTNESSVQAESAPEAAAAPAVEEKHG